MKRQALLLEKKMIEGKVFKGGATWNKLEKFFEKSRDEIQQDLTEVATPEEIRFISEQIEANEYYQKNVRILDSACLENHANLSALFALNSRLCTTVYAQGCKGTQELKSLNYIWFFDGEQNEPYVNKYCADKNLSRQEIDLFAAYDYFCDHGLSVLLVSPNETVRGNAANYGINAIAFDNK